MRIFPFFLIACTLSYCNPVFAQQILYTAANAHSHNDYHQQNPFFKAYQEQFGSIEADIHLRSGRLLVGHDSADLTDKRTLENMYLAPLAKFIEENNGFAYKDPGSKLQLLIDIKTDSIATLNALTDLLRKYPA